MQELWAADSSDSWTSVRARCLSSARARQSVQGWLSARCAAGQVDDKRLEITILQEKKEDLFLLKPLDFLLKQLD